MPSERQPKDVRLTGIHIDLVDQIVTLEAQDGRRAKLSFGPPTPLFGAQSPPTEPDTPDELVADDGDTGWPEPDPALKESQEKQQTLILSGRLRSQPKAGRPDRQGRPTAWARLAVQEEGADHLYSATFYRATTAIALALPRGAQVTLEGYPRDGDAAKKRLDTLSVIALHDYPRKPTMQVGEGVT